MAAPASSVTPSTSSAWDTLSHPLQRALVKSGTNTSQHRAIFSQGLLSVYQKHTSTLKDKHVIVSGYVYEGGLGDFHHMLYAAETLKKAHPDWKVQIISDWEGLDRIRLPEGIFTHPVIPITATDTKNKACSETLGTTFEEADLVVDTPSIKPSLAIPKEWLERETEYSTKLMKLFEYGFFDDRKRKCYSSMGLAPFELGIVIKELETKRSISFLKHAELKAILLTSPSGASLDEVSYDATTELALGYIPSTNSRIAFIFASILSVEEGTRNLDIIVPVDEEELIRYLEYIDLLGLDIKELHFFSSTTGKLEGKKIYESGKDTGKVIRILNPFPLTHADMMICSAKATRCMGCTGDHSFSDAVSLEKLPFYTILEHKERFFDSLVKLSEEVFGCEDGGLVQYLKSLDALKNSLPRTRRAEFLSIIKDLARSFNTPRVYKEWQQLTDIIKSEYSFKERFSALTERKLLMGLKPEINAIEEALFTDLIARAKPLSVCQKELDEALTALGL